MTAESLIIEITSRCGEGYENYSDRAKAMFNAAVRELISNPSAKQEALTGLISTGEYTFLADSPSVLVSDILAAAGCGVGIIRYMDYTSPDDGEGYINAVLEQVEQHQERAMQLCSNLAYSVDTVLLYRYERNLSDASDGMITLLGGLEFEADGVIMFSVIGWSDTYLNTDINEMSTLFAPAILEVLIQQSVAKLRQEIAS
jgi:hypothetical protein